jgi:deoxyribodipyrimidine photo-lyase
MNRTSIHWFRLDLRLADNPALVAALKPGGPVVPVFIWSPDEEVPWQPGGASKWWLHQSLAALDASLRAAGGRLVIRRGPALDTLRALVKETGASAVFWNRRCEPAMIARDAGVEQALRHDGLAVECCNSGLLREPSTVRNRSGQPFQVFTPFWRHCLAEADPPEPIAAPRQVPAPARWPASLALDELGLQPRHRWADGFRAVWHPGEEGAVSAMRQFLPDGFDSYTARRDLPGTAGTSRLSPHLHFGEISPRQVWHSLRVMACERGLPKESWRSSQFLTELGWREFAHHLLYHFPHTATEPLRAEFKRFPWRSDATLLGAWQSGKTGFPIVDAGMRELWATGWMHNRVRMIVASFLVKDLLLSWAEGARWFWDTLVDADLASNTLGWQWTAGCGADAAPYFRVFNPARQGEKFDGDGEYTRRWCPELAKLPAPWIHAPEQAPATVLAAAGVRLESTYPQPVVNHAAARQSALAALASLKSEGVGREL